MFDGGVGKAVVGLEQHLLEGIKVQARAALGTGAKGLIGNGAAKCEFLQIQKAGRALDVGEVIRWHIVQLFPVLSAAQCPLKLLEQRFKMIFHHAIKVNQIAVNIVEYLCLGGLFHKEQCRCTAEWLYVAGVFGKQRQNVFGKFTFAADPRDDGLGHVYAPRSAFANARA